MSTPIDPFHKPEPSGEPPYAPPAYGPPQQGYGQYPPQRYPSQPYGQEHGQQGYGPRPGYGPAPGYGTPPPGWGQPPYGGPQETSSKAVVALVCAIASFVVLPLFPAIAALVVSSGATREIDASGGRLTGRGLVTGAKVTAWANIAVCALVLVLVLLVLVVFAGSATVSATTT